EGGRRRDFAMLYLFNADGSLRGDGGDGAEGGAEIREFASEDEAAAIFADFEKRLASLGSKPGDIVVRPFRLERFGIEFGLIPRPPEQKGDDWAVILEPGNCMAFFPPWDGGYDT
ncbi:MAG TPA: hypothetical protein VFF65_14080, partial [Phycisphaerales bacterium]|nr:hypothetical protein [Phycisphaerales bacterium]